MTVTLDVKDFQGQLQHLDALLRDAERTADPAARARLQQIVQALLGLHGAALERLLDLVADAGEAGEGVIDACGRDDVVSGLLLLHGLHPLGVEDRVRLALDGVRPFIRSHGGNVELLEVSGSVARLRLHGNCHSCPSSAVTMQQTVEEAIYGRAPEITSVEVEAEACAAPAADGARFALPLV